MSETMRGPYHPHVQAGIDSALAVTGTHRLRALPDVPTFAEQGLADIDANFWWGLVGPRGMPRAVVERLNAEMRWPSETHILKVNTGRIGDRTKSRAPPELRSVYQSAIRANGKAVVATTGLTID